MREPGSLREEILSGDLSAPYEVCKCIVPAGRMVGTPGLGNTIWLNEIQTLGATDVSGYDSLQPPASFVPVTKRLILNVETDLGIEPDNLEGMAFGPALPDGRLPLILVSDNKFAPSQSTQFIVLAVELASSN